MSCMYYRDSFNLTRNDSYVMLVWFESFHCDYTQLPALNNTNLTLFNQTNCTFFGQENNIYLSHCNMTGNVTLQFLVINGSKFRFVTYEMEIEELPWFPVNKNHMAAILCGEIIPILVFYVAAVIYYHISEKETTEQPREINIDELAKDT